MAWWHSIIYGLLQGLTEFLPVSSSGHLRVAGHFAGLERPQTLFDVFLHLGTLLAVVLYFRKETWDMVVAPFRAVAHLARGRGTKRLLRDSGFRSFLFVVIGTVPTGIIGFFLGDYFESYAASMRFVAFMFLVNSLILFLGPVVFLPMASRNRMNSGFQGLRVLDALVIGTVQGAAVLRGISRSGTTISFGLMMGVDRKCAGTYSFLLSIPAILGATLLSVRHGIPGRSIDVNLILLGTAVSFLSGLVALKVLMRIVKSGKLYRFGWYTLVLGLGLLFWLQWGENLQQFVEGIIHVN